MPTHHVADRADVVCARCNHRPGRGTTSEQGADECAACRLPERLYGALRQDQAHRPCGPGLPAAQRRLALPQMPHGGERYRRRRRSTRGRPAPAPPQAASRQPASAQQQALRSACQRDFMAYCSRVRPTGAAALNCLQRNAASLSPRCRTAVSAAGGGAAPTAAQPAAATPLNRRRSQCRVRGGGQRTSGGLRRGKPGLLENSDLISDRTRLDLQPDSELRFCHFKASRLLTLRGPARALVSADGVTDESGRALSADAGS